MLVRYAPTLAVLLKTIIMVQFPQPLYTIHTSIEKNLKIDKTVDDRVAYLQTKVRKKIIIICHKKSLNLPHSPYIFSTNGWMMLNNLTVIPNPFYTTTSHFCFSLRSFYVTLTRKIRMKIDRDHSRRMSAVSLAPSGI